ncbi:hypothetical protein EB796_015542 [Bugula neritina]|uniref:Uncharacterized protein n=1 Tax=Bugula neritina TaxID=10212 RepID=A0A7J7JK29_BUGNE|nr:hypothetical protein EB796_015542 [Bugula neritina]
METRHSTDDWAVVYGGEAVCEQVDHGASESTQWVDSSCALSDGEGRDMSLFNRFRKSSKRSKSSTSISRPDVQTSPYSYSARRHRSTSSGNSLNSSHTGSSEDFPVLTPSPFGSLRDVDNCEAGDCTPSTSSYTAADTSSLSSVPSISCCGASTPQRLEHYNRHKKFESDRKTKKRIKDKPPKLTRSSATGSSATDRLESPNETSGLVLSSPNIADIESTTPTEAVQHILSTPVTSQPTCTYPECAAEQVDVLKQEDVVEQEDIVYTSADELHVHHSIPLISSITLSQQIISQHSLDPAQSADTSCAIFPAAFSSSSAETDPCVGSTFSEGTPSSSVEEDKITPVSVDKQKSAASDTFYFSCEEEFVTPETSFTSDQPSLTMPPISSASRPTSPATLPLPLLHSIIIQKYFKIAHLTFLLVHFHPLLRLLCPLLLPLYCCAPTTPAVPPTTPAVPYYPYYPPTSSVFHPLLPLLCPLLPLLCLLLAQVNFLPVQKTAVPSQPTPIKEDTILPESHTSLSARDNVIGEAVIPPQTDSGNQIVEEAVLPESRATLSSSAPECSSFAPREICLPRLLPSPRVQKKSDKMADVTKEGPANSTHLRVSDNNKKEISADVSSSVTPADASSSVTPADASSSVTPADPALV